MSAGIELQPDELEALQIEGVGDDAPVRVAIVGVSTPIRTQALPRKSGGTKTITVTTTPSKILSADHRRASAQVVSIGQNMLVAFNMASAGDASRMALWPASLPFVLTADSELWVAAATATTSISIVTEFWANGE